MKVTQSCLILCSPPGSTSYGDSPGKNTGVGCHALLQQIFLTQGSIPRLLHLLPLKVGSLPLAPPKKIITSVCWAYTPSSGTVLGASIQLHVILTPALRDDCCACFLLTSEEVETQRNVSQVTQTSGTAQIWTPVCFTLQSVSLPTTQCCLGTSHY